jgi:hypothetical protein
MENKIRKILTLFITIFFIGTAFFVPASSIKIEQTKNINDIEIDNYESIDQAEFTKEENIRLLDFDTKYIVNPNFPINTNGDNDDAGYKTDAGDRIARSDAIYPGEMADDWPGRGRTGKLSASDDEDWYFFTVCNGQDIVITMTPPAGHNYDIGLWDDNENEVATSTNTGSDSELITYTATFTEKWYLRILYISGTGEGQYSFDVTLTTQNDADTGDDAGDDFASATSIDPGVYEGYLDMNDEEDWYKFQANEGQGIYFLLRVRGYAYLSDFDIYLYNPSGELVHYETYYYNDILEYPVDVSGQWRVKIDIFPGYTDIPDPTEWEYYTYGSGPYYLEFSLEESAPMPPGPIPQPEIIPVAHTFKLTNDPESNLDEYGYLAAIPACNYLDNGDRHLAPIVYTGDNLPTNWFGTVDDTTDYLLEDWQEYLSGEGKSPVEYIVDPDPVKAAADIATNLWGSSELAVVAVDGSGYEDTVETVLEKSKKLPRNIEVITVPSDSPDLKQFVDYYAKTLILGPKWGAIKVEIEGAGEEPSFLGIYPHHMKLAGDWWPEHVDEKTDLYYPIPKWGVYAAGVLSVDDIWDMKISKFECDRHPIKVKSQDSVLSVKVTTETPEDLLVFLIDPKGNIRAPDPPDWNGGEINPIHGWNGMDTPDIPPDCDEWRAWEPEPHTEFTAEVLHPEKGTWRAIVVPRYTTGSSNIQYTITGTIRKINPKRADAAMSAANAAVIASQEHVPLLYVNEGSIPAETQDAFDQLGVNKVIFVQNNEIGNAVEAELPTKEANLKTMSEIVDYIKDYDHTENYITITSLKSGDGYFAPTAMLAAYHCSPVLRIGEAPGNPAGMANKIDTWRMWEGDYYHGNRAPGHLPDHHEPIKQLSRLELLIKCAKYLITGNESKLPPYGLDAKRYWNEELHNTIRDWIRTYDLDVEDEQEAYVIVSPRKDIRLVAHAVMMGNNSYSGHIPGKTPAYTNDIIIRNILYPALIFANPNRDVTTTQFINFPDRIGSYNRWTTNDGVYHNPITSTYENKKSFSSHNRIYEGHSLWDAHLERMNDGASVMYYSGHGTGGSGISAQYYQTENCNYPEQIWPDSWRSYLFDNWETTRDDGTRWFNPEPPTLYDFIHFKWQDQLYGNLKSNAIFYQSCSTGQQFGPLVYLDHGALLWYGNAETGSCPPADLEDDWFFEDILIHGEAIGPAYSKNIWKIYRDYTTCDPTSMYGVSSIFGDDGINTVQCIYGDPTIIIYSPEWTSPTPIDSILEE